MPQLDYLSGAHLFSMNTCLYIVVPQMPQESNTPLRARNYSISVILQYMCNPIPIRSVLQILGHLGHLLQTHDFIAKYRAPCVHPAWGIGALTPFCPPKHLILQCPKG